jgi:hypothetical protein
MHVGRFSLKGKVVALCVDAAARDAAAPTTSARVRNGEREREGIDRRRRPSSYCRRITRARGYRRRECHPLELRRLQLEQLAGEGEG